MGRIREWLKHHTSTERVVAIAAVVAAIATVGILFFAGLDYLAPNDRPTGVAEADKVGQQPMQPNQIEPSIKAALLLGRADQFRSSGDVDKARDAYISAASLYRAYGDLEGEADVLSDLGDLERQLGHIDKARDAYTEARVLFKAIGDRRSDVDMQISLDGLEYIPAPNDKAVETRTSDHPTNRVELIAYVADASGLKLEEAEKAVDAMFDGVVKTLVNGDEVRLVGFGTFSVTHRQATMGRNPRTGEAIHIPASTRPIFKAAKALKEAVN